MTADILSLGAVAVGIGFLVVVSGLWSTIRYEEKHLGWRRGGALSYRKYVRITAYRKRGSGGRWIHRPTPMI